VAKFHYAIWFEPDSVLNALATSLAWQSNRRCESMVTPSDQFGCNLQPAASDRDCLQGGSQPELRCTAKDNSLSLDSVELRVVPQLGNIANQNFKCRNHIKSPS